MQSNDRTSVGTPGRGERLRQALWLLGLLGLFMLTFLALPPVLRPLGLPPLIAVSLGQLIMLAGVIAFTLADGAGVRLLRLGTPWRGFDLGLIVAVLAFHIIGSVTVSLVLLQSGESLQDTGAAQMLRLFGQYDTGTFLLIALGLAALSGITEELLFRGYLISRLERIGLGAWPCILLSALIFGLVHWPGYGFLSSISKAITFGLPTGIYFWYRRALTPLMAAHAFMNFSGFMLAHLVMRYFPELSGF